MFWAVATRPLSANGLEMKAAEAEAELPSGSWYRDVTRGLFAGYLPRHSLAAALFDFSSAPPSNHRAFETSQPALDRFTGRSSLPTNKAAESLPKISENGKLAVVAS